MTPQTGPTLDFTEGWGALAHNGIGDDGENFDTWVGFDRMPRITADLPSCGDFTIETVLNVADVTVGGVPMEPTQFHTGIWIGFQDPALDGLMYGPFTSRNTIRLERVGFHEASKEINSSDELGLRAERRGDLFVLSYREEPEGEWQEYGSFSYPGEKVSTVGVFSKNWASDNPEVRVDFDYISVAVSQPQPPTLEDPCPEAKNLATVGAPFVKPLTYLPGTPLPTTVTVTGPGAFDTTTGLYTFTPESTGEVEVTVTAEMEGQPPASVTFTVCVVSQAEHYEEFDLDDIADLDPIWELYNPAAVDPPPFSIVDSALQIDVPATPVFDHWTTADMAPQVRVRAADEPLLEGEFTVETQVHLEAYTEGTPFQPALAIGFGQFEMFYWGPYMGTNVRLERSGVNAMVDIQNTDETVILRASRDCTDTLRFYLKPETGDWQYAGAFSIPQAWLDTDDGDDSLWVGVIMKTWGAGTAATATFDYFDILEGTCGVQEPQFRRGDVNVDGAVNIADARTPFRRGTSSRLSRRGGHK